MDKLTLMILVSILIKIGIFILSIYLVLQILRLLASKKRTDEYLKGILNELNKNNKD
jgi:hypothetical protein